MYEYRSEILWVSTKFWSDKASGKDAQVLDAFLNQKSAEGWELVTYDYMATSAQLRGAFLITFKREKQ